MLHCRESFNLRSVCFHSTDLGLFWPSFSPFSVFLFDPGRSIINTFMNSRHLNDLYRTVVLNLYRLISAFRIRDAGYLFSPNRV